MPSPAWLALVFALSVGACTIAEEDSAPQPSTAPNQATQSTAAANNNAGAGGTAPAPEATVENTTPSPPPEIPPFPDLCTSYTPNAFVAASDCRGNCDRDQDCSDNPDLPIQCLQLPGAARGTCLYSLNSPCFTDDDCDFSYATDQDYRCIAITEDGVRTCLLTGVQCNTDEHCLTGETCSFPDATFLGQCTSGGHDDICARPADCAAGLACATSPVEGMIDPAHGHWGRCSDGRGGAACDGDANCQQGRCIDHQCSSGQLGEICDALDGCLSGLKCITLPSPFENQPPFRYCSDGLPASFAQCMWESDCAAGIYCSKGLCQDGSPDSYCDFDTQCQSGRCAAQAYYPICTTGEPGSRCMDGSDCISGTCGRALVLDWELGTCD